MALGTETAPQLACTCSVRVYARFLFTEMTVSTQELAVQPYLAARPVPALSSPLADSKTATVWVR